MSGFDNEVMFAPGERLEPSNAQSITLMQDSTITNVSRINYVGDPNGVVSANPSSISHDPTSGFLWLKISGTGTTVWQRIFAEPSGSVVKFTENSGTALPDGAGNVNWLGPNSALTGYSPWTVGSGSTATVNLPGTVKWVVNSVANLGTHTTIQAAITAASSGDDIFITPGTYTENLTLKVGVNLTAYGCDGSFNATGKVIISGTCTLTTAGSVTISGIQLQTNSAALLAVTGSAASIVNLNNCYLNCTNATGITFSSSSASSQINMLYCTGNIGTTGIALIAHSSAGVCQLFYSSISNSGSTVTANTVSAGNITLFYSKMNVASTSSSTGSLGFFHSDVDLDSLNATCITAGGSGSHVFYCSRFESGTASAISISSLANVNDCDVGSSNTNCITGAGSLFYSDIKFTRTSSTINVTTQTGGTLVGGKFQAPSAGFLGERIVASVLTGAAVSLSTGAPTTITSISLTPGVWDISIIGSIQNATTGTVFSIAISTTTNSFGAAVNGDSVAVTPTMPTAAAYNTLVIPAFRTVLTTTTTHYFISSCNFTVGTPAAFGRISAVRVG